MSTVFSSQLVELESSICPSVQAQKRDKLLHLESATKSYRSILVAVSALSPEIVQRMSELYLDNYEGSSQARFLEDLHEKDEVLLLDFQGALVGFTTLVVYEVTWKNQPVRIVYSGDTIVSPRHWGQQELAFSWIERIGQIKRESPSTPLYWFLLVKGHRTFKYLPVFGKTFFPHWEIDRSDLKPLADQLALAKFGNDYNPAIGVVEFPVSRGHLRPHIAAPSEEELAKASTRFFIKKNPGYTKGYELVCLCELELSNMKPLTARIFQRALTEPLSP